MARRKRKEDDVAWEPPEFDEVGYMRQEIQNAKIATVVIAWAVAGAILAYLVALWIPVVGYLVGLAAFGVLYVLLPMLGLPIHGFKRRDWISHASVYFFSWLAFSIVLLNAPFGDHTYPVIGTFEVGSFSASSNATMPAANLTTCVAASTGGTVSLPVRTGNNTLYVLFRATDNVGVASINASVSALSAPTLVPLRDVSGQPSACGSNPAHNNAASTYAVTYPLVANNIQITVTAVDTSGHITTESITVLPQPA